MATIQSFHSSLLREKFVIHDPKASRTDSDSITALSNRMIVTLQKGENGKLSEEYIIRAQNMHSCIRYAARLIQSFNTGGSLLNRANGYDWLSAWESTINDFERHNKDLWIAVYRNGKITFKSGTHHVLLDLIEKCDFENDQTYDHSIPLAEKAFKQTGKVVKIDYDANVALVVTFEKKEARCGIIFRGPERTTTFNFTATTKPKETINIPQCLSATAAFLEGIQLGFTVGMNNFKIRVGILDRLSPAEKYTKEAQKRLGRLNAEIANLESTFAVRYRPEKPEFYRIVSESEELAARTLKTPDKKTKEKPQTTPDIPE